MRPALPFALILSVIIIVGCEPPTPPPRPPGSSGELLPAFAARHRAWLHAERDSREGFEAAVEILIDLVARKVYDSFDLLNLARARLLTGDAVTPEVATELRDTLGVARATIGDRIAPDVDYLLALIAIRAGEPDAAHAPILRVTEARPDSTAAWYQLGRVCEETGDLEGAAAAFATLLELEKDHRPGTYHHMLVLGRLGRRDEADAVRARFESLPAEGQADPERCSFTEVSFRRAALPDDTAPIELAWKESRVSVPSPSLSHWSGSGTTVALGGSAVRAIAWGALDPAGTRIGLAAVAGALREIHRDASGNPILAEATIPCPGEVRDLRLADIDHDGDVDAIVLSDTVALLRNDGEGAWTALPPLPDSPTGIPASARCDFEDFDLGNDVDLAFPSESGIELYWNRRDHWEHESIHDPTKRSLFFAEDFDGDGRAEILGLGGAAGWTRTRFAADGNWAIEIALNGPSVRAAAIGDLDNDGDLDLVISDGRVTQWLQNIDGEFVVAGEITPEPSRELHCVDLDGDLRLEVVALGSDGTRVFRSSGAESNAAWVLKLDGRRDQRDGIGCVVEQVAGRVWQTRMVKEPGGLHLGLGANSPDALDGVRLRWPAGIIQALPRDRFEVAKDGTALIRQKEGLVASCPFLFARGESGWQFVTDVLGIAPLDEWRPPGAPELFDPQEHVRIPGDALAPVDGSLHLAITEELREITYLDAVELRAIDHPVGTVLYTDESTTQGTIVPLTVLVVPEAEITTPHRVQTGSGSDFTEAIRAQDAHFLHPELTGAPQLAGWTRPQRLAFTPPNDTVWLLLTGRVAWYDSPVGSFDSRSCEIKG